MDKGRTDLHIPSTKPSFIFVGPSKAGSSWFFEILGEHPQVFVPPNKTTFFFTDYYAQGLSWYESFFAKSGDHLATGEICHDYLASPEALRRIRDYRPDMKLVCCLRNPYARALSSWRFFGRNGMDEPTLADQGVRTPSVFEQGNYATQLTYLQSIIPKSQLLIFFFEELSTAPADVARRLYEFIGVDAAFVPPSLHKRVNVNAKPRIRTLARAMQFIHEQSWKRSRLLSNLIGRVKRFKPLRHLVRSALYKEPLNSTDWREHLAEFPETVIARYEWEIRKLQKMVNRDLSGWLATSSATLEPDDEGHDKVAPSFNHQAACSEKYDPRAAAERINHLATETKGPHSPATLLRKAGSE